MGRGLAAAAACGLLLAACGARPAVVVNTPVPGATVTAVPTALPTSTPSPTPSASPSPRLTFTAKVVADGGANIRVGPGMDQRKVALAARGSVQTFDGWYRHADDAPQPDATTNRIEAWSRDWYHLANGAGWIHSSTLDGFPPTGMPQMDPGSIPIVIT